MCRYAQVNASSISNLCKSAAIYLLNWVNVSNFIPPTHMHIYIYKYIHTHLLMESHIYYIFIYIYKLEWVKAHEYLLLKNRFLDTLRKSLHAWGIPAGLVYFHFTMAPSVPERPTSGCSNRILCEIEELRSWRCEEAQRQPKSEIEYCACQEQRWATSDPQKQYYLKELEMECFQWKQV